MPGAEVGLVDKWERGTNAPGADSLIAIRSLTSASIDWLLGYGPDDFTAAGVEVPAVQLEKHLAQAVKEHIVRAAAAGEFKSAGPAQPDVEPDRVAIWRVNGAAVLQRTLQNETEAFRARLQWHNEAMELKRMAAELRTALARVARDLGEHGFNSEVTEAYDFAFQALRRMHVIVDGLKEPESPVIAATIVPFGTRMAVSNPKQAVEGYNEWLRRRYGKKPGEPRKPPKVGESQAVQNALGDPEFVEALKKDHAEWAIREKRTPAAAQESAHKISTAWRGRP